MAAGLPDGLLSPFSPDRQKVVIRIVSILPAQPIAFHELVSAIRSRSASREARYAPIFAGVYDERMPGGALQAALEIAVASQQGCGV